MEEKDQKVEPQVNNSNPKKEAPVIAEEPKRLFSKLIITGVVSLIALGLLGFIILIRTQMSKPSELNVKSLVTPAVTVQPVEKNISTDSANWKTYNYPKSNFSTKYPEGLSVISENGSVTFQYYPTSQSVECVRLVLGFQDIDPSEDLGKWVKEKYPTRGNAGPPGQNQTPSQIFPYTNSVDKTITGYWMPTGAEVEGKMVYIKHNDIVAALLFPGCAGAGDTYKAHPIAMSIMENMIASFKFGN